MFSLNIAISYRQYQGKVNTKRIRGIPAWPRRHARRMPTGVLRQGVRLSYPPIVREGREEIPKHQL